MRKLRQIGNLPKNIVEPRFKPRQFFFKALSLRTTQLIIILRFSS